MKINIDTSRMSEALKRTWEENPLAVIGTATLAVGVLAKLIDSVSAAKGRRAYAKQVDYRVRHKK